ncbi:hypothetical protein J3R75_003901 [Oligosphaera ethanolica]|uniref:Uncharacterized protein n=1 Tax=Oligosphaera ethanolica TaxID=760260 RepID=A0AAE3VJU8_9BACT|nr:hypothetical protein [Oligosphaera ethanolica]
MPFRPQSAQPIGSERAEEHGHIVHCTQGGARFQRCLPWAGMFRAFSAAAASRLARLSHFRPFLRWKRHNQRFTSAPWIMNERVVQASPACAGSTTSPANISPAAKRQAPWRGAVIVAQGKRAEGARRPGYNGNYVGVPRPLLPQSAKLTGAKGAMELSFVFAMWHLTGSFLEGSLTWGCAGGATPGW